MRAKIKTKHNKYGITFVAILDTKGVKISKDFDDESDAENWLTDRVESLINRSLSEFGSIEDTKPSKKVQ